jgi:hypothetical protein
LQKIYLFQFHNGTIKTRDLATEFVLCNKQLLNENTCKFTENYVDVQ